MKKIFVTGITGLLGANLVNDLLEKGFIVKGLIRDISKFNGRQHPNLILVQGDLFDDLTTQLPGIDAVIHIAAETKQHLIHYIDYWKINCNATIQLFNAAILCKVKRFVFVSTSNTLGYGSLHDLGTEQKSIKPPFIDSFYACSKLEAENYLLENKNKIDTIIINPGFMLGAFDSKPSSGKIILLGWKKKIIFYPPGGKSFVHVKDVSGGIMNSLEKAKNGEKYLLVNENLTYFYFFKKLNNVATQDPIMIKIPKPVLLSLGYFGDLLRFFKIKTYLSSTNMKILCIDNFYSNQKSITELKIEYQPIDLAIKDAINFFKGSPIEKHQ